MLQLEQMRQQSGDSKRFLKYKVSVYQRAVCDVEYEFDEKRYNITYDGTTKQVLMDANPYEAVSYNQLKDLENYYKEKKLKSFLDTYDEFSSITQFDNVSLSIENVKNGFRCWKESALESVFWEVFFAKDDGKITYGIIAGASAVATIIIYLLLGKIF